MKPRCSSSWRLPWRDTARARPEDPGQRGFVGSRLARALVAPWTPPPGHEEPPIVIGDPFPNVRGNPRRRAQTQTLWIDVESLLPLQWETPVDALAFRYDPTIAITRPDEILPPACVP